MRFTRGVFALLLAGLSASSLAQSFSTKQPVQIYTSDPGAAADILAREEAQSLTAAFGTPAVVVNRGGNAIILAQQVARSAPDGHTLLSIGGNFFWLQPLLQSDVPYDPVKDFAPVTLTARSPNLLIVQAALPVKSVKELIAYAKANPGKLNFGHAGTGTGNHMAAELFKSMTQTNIVLIGYKGAAPVMNAVLAGDIHGFFPGIATAMPQVKAGKIRALGVTSDKRSDLAPGIPTVSESGLPGFQSGVDYVVFAPAKTPAAAVEQLNKVMVAHLRSPEVKDRLFKLGMDAVGSTPAELAARMKADRDSMGKVIKEQGIHVD